MRHVFALVALMAVTSCAAVPLPTIAPEPTPEIVTTIFPTDPPPPPTPVPDPIYVNLMWQLREPLYAIDSQTGLLTQPWLRTHITRYYHTRATTLQQFPNVKATFGISPLLMLQLDALNSGTRDAHWEMGARPAASLTETDKRFILKEFFVASNPQVIAQFPRYLELLQKRGGDADENIVTSLQTFSEQDLRDLQVWFNLAWFDANLLGQPPLKTLVDKGRDFTEADKQALFGTMSDVLRNLLPLYRAMQDSGQIELSTMPFADPVLPLIMDTDVQRNNDRNAVLPNPSFKYPRDATEHLMRAAQRFQRVFGAAPRGLWPAGGALAQPMFAPVADAGFGWLVSGEQTLARALGINTFARDGAGVPQQADDLYRPYATSDQRVHMFFADAQLSAVITSLDTTQSAEQAAQQIIARLQAIHAQLRASAMPGPHLITLALDSVRHWDAWPDGGHAFLTSLYQQLSAAIDRGEIVTVTPSDYLARFPDTKTLPQVRPSDFRAWIGGPEQNAAWQYLKRTRGFVEDFLSEKLPAPPEAVAAAYDWVLLAEGADWFTQIGAEAPDAAQRDGDYRELLGRAYDALGVPRPEFSQVPLNVAPVAAPSQVLQGVLSPTVTIDGVAEVGEWDRAGSVSAVGRFVTGLYYGISDKDLVVRVDGASDWASVTAPSQPVRVGVYMRVPSSVTRVQLSRLGPDETQRSALGMSATHLLEWTFDASGTGSTVLYTANKDGGWSAVTLTSTRAIASVATGTVLEMRVSHVALGSDKLRKGEAVLLGVIVVQGGRRLAQFPINSVAEMKWP